MSTRYTGGRTTEHEVHGPVQKAMLGLFGVISVLIEKEDPLEGSAL